ncbi:uncharacterized protein ACIBXB_005526 isoform 1-T1 [Morphnus guianensis]
MDEQPQVAATKLFGRPAETCEEKIQSHLRSLRKVLAEFLDWRTSEEKRHRDYLETSEAERRRIEAEFERLHRFLAEKERAVLGRLAELEAAFEAAQAEKSLRVAEGITRLHGLIGQLEVKRTPQVRPLLTEKLPKSAAHGVLTPLFPLILGYREHPKQVCGIWSLPPLCHPDCGGAGLGLNIAPVTSLPIVSLLSWSEMRLHLPSELPAELEKSLSSCRRQRDALWEALKEFRGVWGGILFFWEGSRGIFGEFGGVWGEIRFFWEGFRGTLGEFQGISGGKGGCSKEDRSRHSTMLTFSLSFQTQCNPKQSQEGGDVPAEKKRRSCLGSPAQFLSRSFWQTERARGGMKRSGTRLKSPGEAKGRPAAASGSPRGDAGHGPASWIPARGCFSLRIPGCCLHPRNTSSLPAERLPQLASCRKSRKSLRSAPNLPSPMLPLPLASTLGVLMCCRSPLR